MELEVNDMTKTANFPISIDSATKPKFFVRQPRYNAETEAAIQEAKDIIAGKIFAKAYSSVAEMNADLDAEDDV